MSSKVSTCLYKVQRVESPTQYVLPTATSSFVALPYLRERYLKYDCFRRFGNKHYKLAAADLQVHMGASAAWGLHQGSSRQ